MSIGGCATWALPTSTCSRPSGMGRQASRHACTPISSARIDGAASKPQLGVNNLLGTEPPLFVGQSGGFYDIGGRMVFASVTMKL